MAAVSMRRLGALGRFGNQILQVAFLGCYTLQEQLDAAQIPPWVGDALFTLEGAPLTSVKQRFPEFVEEPDTPTLESSRILRERPRDVDLATYAQWPMHWFAPWEKEIRSWFRVRPEVERRFTPALSRLHDGKTLVGLHFRRGDFGQSIFPIIPVSWYQQKLAELWPTLDRPRLFIATEDPQLVDAFQAYRPQTAQSLGVSLRANPLPHYRYLKRDVEEQIPLQLDFFPDWYLLTQCDYMLAPPSTFSFTAAMLGQPGLAFYRASLAAAGFSQTYTYPWRDHPFPQENVADYPHLWEQGIKLPSNPYWKG